MFTKGIHKLKTPSHLSNLNDKIILFLDNLRKNENFKFCIQNRCKIELIHINNICF